MTEQPIPPIQEDGWSGMFANRRIHIPTGFVLLADNFWLDDGVWRGRPGLTQLGSAIGGGAAVQGIHQFEELDGTYHLVAFANADMYEYDWGTDSWTQTDLSVEGITMSPSADLDFCVSRGRLIVTDGVNTPWMWDGGATFTTLTEAPVAQGCTVYYDRVFFFDKNSNRVEFDWSDVGLPTDGYAADDQAWEFAQTDTGAVRALVGMNDFMPVFKQDSITYLEGRTSDSFQTDAVREGVSETEGTVALHSVAVVEGDVYYLSQEGPRALLGGTQRQTINETPDGDHLLEELWSNVNKSQWSGAYTVYDPPRNHVWFLIPTSDQYLDTALVYNTKSGAWQQFSFNINPTCAAGPVEDTSGNEWVLIGDDNGQVYQYGDESVRSDDGSSITRILRSRSYGRSVPTVVKRLVEARYLLNLDTTVTNAELRPVPDFNTGTGTQFSITNTGRQRYRRGFNSVGYSVGWELFLDTAGETMDVESVLVRMTQVGAYETV